MNGSVGVNVGGGAEAAPASVAAENAAPVQEQGGAAADWTAGLSAENAELAGKYGYKSMDEVLGRIRQIESVSGEEALRSVMVPADGADEAAWGELYNKLGRPETADAYGLSGVLAGAEMTPMDEAFLGNMSAVMHKAGLNTKQARDLTLACHEQFQALAESMDESYQKGLAEAREMYPPQTIEKAKRALEAVGLDKTARADIERALGPVRAIEIFSKASAALLPDTMPQGATGGSFTGSPDAARARADSLLADKNFCERYMRGDRDAVAQIENLYKQATAR